MHVAFVPSDVRVQLECEVYSKKTSFDDTTTAGPYGEGGANEERDTNFVLLHLVTQSSLNSFIMEYLAVLCFLIDSL